MASAGSRRIRLVELFIRHNGGGQKGEQRRCIRRGRGQRRNIALITIAGKRRGGSITVFITVRVSHLWLVHIASVVGQLVWISEMLAIPAEQTVSCLEHGEPRGLVFLYNFSRNPFSSARKWFHTDLPTQKRWPLSCYSIMIELLLGLFHLKMPFNLMKAVSSKLVQVQVSCALQAACYVVFDPSPAVQGTSVVLWGEWCSSLTKPDVCPPLSSTIFRSSWRISKSYSRCWSCGLFCFTAYSFHRNFLKLGIYM